MRLFIFLIFITASCCSHASLDFSSIYHGAKLANLAYSPSSSIGPSLSQMGYKLTRQHELPETQVSYFLAKNARQQVIAVRGTANLENVLVDLDIQIKLNPQLDIQLHQGFSVSAQAIYEDVKAYLDPSLPILTTGHSLGGAVALILAMHLDKDHYPLKQSMTFGQPKVTNVSGAGQFSHLPVIRIVTPLDLVPLVPILSPLQLQELDIYWHIGQEVILMEDKKYAVTSGLKSMLRASKFVNTVPNERNFEDHKMKRYLNLIEQKQNNALQVPYSTGISLFGFSLD